MIQELRERIKTFRVRRQEERVGTLRIRKQEKTSIKFKPFIKDVIARSGRGKSAWARRGNRMLYRAAMLPCDCRAALAMTWFFYCLGVKCMY
ncbi:hypothetical protein DIU36_14390 [Mucilaginibacter rubeus]|nr:hypothetical protein DIU36_14390 [Mucilaginibacter rubeus]